MKKGFTLVELLFVMAIIAILAGFAIANVKGSTRKAKELSLKHDLRNTIDAQNLFFSKNQEYFACDTMGNFGLTNGSNNYCYTFDKNTGETTNHNVINISITKDSRIVTRPITCSDGSPGFDAYSSFGEDTEEYSSGDNKFFSYNSCTTGSIQEGLLPDM